MTWSYPLKLFDAYGVELEYMIVDRTSLDVSPSCDALFRAATGESVNDVEPDGPDGAVAWSNELALHVVELKTQQPATSLDGLADAFQSHVQRINKMLEPMGHRLMPGAMHPWMDPNTETVLWPHECNDIYRTYDRIFGCRGHGWGNLQSTHINLPFGDDEEFGRLHAAMRLVLPLLPALAASSPIVDGRHSRFADHRMEVYRTNAQRVPEMTGLVAPEPVFTRKAYEEQILGALYDALAPLDPEGILRHEFANARGAMARFDRGAIEMRVIDIQEAPIADVAVAALTIAVTRALVNEQWTDLAHQMTIPTATLHDILLATITDAEDAVIHDSALLAAFGVKSPIRAGALWKRLLDQTLPDHPAFTPILQRMIHAGTLATRLRAAAGPDPTRTDLHTVYAELADCLHHGRLFRAD